MARRHQWGYHLPMATAVKKLDLAVGEFVEIGRSQPDGIWLYHAVFRSTMRCDFRLRALWTLKGCCGRSGARR